MMGSVSLLFFFFGVVSRQTKCVVSETLVRACIQVFILASLHFFSFEWFFKYIIVGHISFYGRECLQANESNALRKRANNELRGMKFYQTASRLTIQHNAVYHSFAILHFAINIYCRRFKFYFPSSFFFFSFLLYIGCRCCCCWNVSFVMRKKNHMSRAHVYEKSY